MADFGTGSEASEDKSLRRDHLCRGEKRIQKTKGSTIRAPRIRNDNVGIIKDRGRIRVLGIEDVRMDSKKILQIYGSSHNIGRSCHFW